MRTKIVLILLSGLLCSLTIAAVDVASRSIMPFWLTAFRLMAAWAVFCIILAIARPVFQWRVRTAFDILIVGMLNIGIPFTFLAISMRYISSSLAALLYNLVPPMTLLLAHLLLPDDKLQPAKAAGTLLAVGGAVILMGSNASGLREAHGQGWIGQLLIVLASLANALAVIHTRRRLRREDTMVLAAGQVLASLLVMLPLALAIEGLPPLACYPWQAWVAIVVAALGTPVFGYWLLFYITNKYSASLGGFSGVATPLFSAAIGILFLGEIITLPIAAGAFLVVVGICTLNYF